MVLEFTEEQKKTVNFKSPGVLVIKGTAGSGKSIVGLGRVEYLLKKFQGTEEILVLSYNNNLISYLKYQLKETGLSLKNVQIKTVDKVMFDICKKINKCYSKNLMDSNLYEPGEYEILRKSIIELNYQEKYDFYDKNEMKFLLSETKWIRECDIESFSEYEKIERRGRGNKRKVGKEERKIIYEITRKYEEIMEENKKTDIIKRRKIALEYIKRASEAEKYSHIIIDEAQDLSKLTLKFIKELSKKPETNPYGTVTYLYDTSQSIYENSWLGSGNSFSSLGIDIKGRSRILSRSFRTTKQIHSAAYSLILNDKELEKESEFSEANTFLNDEGIKPSHIHFKNEREQLEYVAKQIKKLAKKYELKDIMIGLRNNKKLEEIKKVLDSKEIRSEIINSNKNYDFSREEVKISTIHSMKGLESKVVFLLDLNDSIIPQNNFNELLEDEIVRKERKLLYVGMTRAKELLCMCSWGKETRFIAEIDSDFINNIDNTEEFVETAEKEVKVNIEAIVRNENDRFENLIKTNEELKKEVEKLREELTKKDKELQQQILLAPIINADSVKETKINIEELRMEIRKKYLGLNHNSIESLVGAEYNYQMTQGVSKTDFTDIYIQYFKVIEIELRDFIFNYSREVILNAEKKKMTCGKLMVLGRKYSEIRKFIEELNKNRFLETRNSTAHGEKCSINMCKKLRKFLLEDNKLEEFLDILNNEKKKVEVWTNLFSNVKRI